MSAFDLISDLKERTKKYRFMRRKLPGEVCRSRRSSLPLALPTTHVFEDALQRAGERHAGAIG
jgi:hypothetical protein